VVESGDVEDEIESPQQDYTRELARATIYR